MLINSKNTTNYYSFHKLIIDKQCLLKNSCVPKDQVPNTELRGSFQISQLVNKSRGKARQPKCKPDQPKPIRLPKGLLT